MASHQPFPPAPPEEDRREPHCDSCGSLFHATADHDGTHVLAALRGEASQDEWPIGYDPAEADRLIGRYPGPPHSHPAVSDVCQLDDEDPRAT